MQILRSTLFSFGYFIFSLFTPVVLFFLPSAWVKRLFSRLDAAETERRIAVLQPFCEGGAVLEVGAGSGRFSKTLSERLRVPTTGVDVCDYSDRSIPFFIYDGRRLPFPDKSYDIVFFAYVLHHTCDQAMMMKEACRVARRHIVIFEDTFTNAIEHLFAIWNCFHNNALHGWVRFRKGYTKGNMAKMPFPFTFRSIQGWRAFFTQFPVELVSQAVHSMGWKPLTKVVFCLKVRSSYS